MPRSAFRLEGERNGSKIHSLKLRPTANSNEIWIDFNVRIKNERSINFRGQSFNEFY